MFIVKCLENGIFDDFYAQKDAELTLAVESLFEAYFLEIFQSSSTPGSIDKATMLKLIDEKFQGDENLQGVFSSELEKFSSPESVGEPTIDEATVKRCLQGIMKNHMKAVTSQREDAEAIIDELQETSGGNYARQMIQRLIQGYKDTGIQGDPF